MAYVIWCSALALDFFLNKSHKILPMTCDCAAGNTKSDGAFTSMSQL